MKALLLANGELYHPARIRERIKLQNFDLIIGIDAGTKHAAALELKPDLIIGDFDSITEPHIDASGSPECKLYPTEKNETDLELGIRYAIGKGADTIVVVGALGGRMDMWVSNILLLAHEEFSSCHVEIWHGEQAGWVARPPGGEIRGKAGDIVSLIPLCSAAGVTTSGLSYHLKDFEFISGSSRGISNVLECDRAYVELCQGMLLLVHSDSGIDQKGERK